MVKIKTQFGNIVLDIDTISYYCVQRDIEKDSVEMTFYFKENLSTISTTLSDIDECIKLIKQIEFEKSFTKPKGNKK